MIGIERIRSADTPQKYLRNFTQFLGYYYQIYTVLAE